MESETIDRTRTVAHVSLAIGLRAPVTDLLIQFTTNHLAIADVPTDTVSLLVRIHDLGPPININAYLGRRRAGCLLLLARFVLALADADRHTSVLTRLRHGARYLPLRTATRRRR